MRPLDDDGIDTFKAIDPDNPKLPPHVVIHDAEVAYFDPPEEAEEELNDFEMVVMLSIVSPIFKEDNKWRVSDGEKEYHVTISDERFMSLVLSGSEPFRAGDIMRANMRTVQWQTSQGLKTSYEVTKVIDHWHPEDHQLSLLDDTSSPKEPPPHEAEEDDESEGG